MIIINGDVTSHLKIFLTDLTSLYHFLEVAIISLSINLGAPLPSHFTILPHYDSTPEAIHSQEISITILKAMLYSALRAL